MKYQEYSPGPKLQKYVLNYWRFEVGGPEAKFPISHETLPEFCFSIVLIKHPQFSGLRILGPMTESFKAEINHETAYLGIRIQPWIHLTELYPDTNWGVNKRWDAPESLGNLFAGIEKDFIEGKAFDIPSNLDVISYQLFKKFACAYDPLIEIVDKLIASSPPNIRVKELLEKIPLGERQLQRRFKKSSGLTLKQYLDIKRFRKSTFEWYHNQEATTSVVLSNGYYDQSHYLRTFNKLMGQSKKSFKKYIDSIQHKHIQNDGFFQDL